jgi:hypothetical protein
MRGFSGREGFVWWHGVVEDNNDPLYLGRCKVRVFGFHSDNKQELPTDGLPWAYPMQPLTSAALSGIGQSPTGLLIGSHVFGFFRDGEHAQDPVMIGSFGGIPVKEADPEKGFADPSGKYPATLEGVQNQQFPIGVSVVEEPDTNRLARNESVEVIEATIVGKKVSEAKVDIQSTPDIKEGKSQWSEPTTPYDAVYPHNHVMFTESGHIKEYDDTPGAERIHEYHASGTFTEIANGWKNNPDGTRVQRIVGDDYEICLGNKKVYIGGKEGLNLVVDGPINLTIIGNGSNIQIDGNINIFAKSDVNLQCDGKFRASGEQMEFYSRGNMAFSGSTISLISDGSVGVIGDRIELNSGDAVLRPKEVKLQ